MIVMDSVGIGALPDAAAFGDEGSNTMGHIAQALPEFFVPNLLKLGLANIDADLPFDKLNQVNGAFGSAIEVSPGKDTTTGHWEISGVEMKQPFPMFYDGFPADFIADFENRIGTKTIGNYAASGTVIINDLGAKHVKTGYPIVYTSADSVFQIAIHEEVSTIERQYEICEIAREMLKDDMAVGRVIARPFLGKDPNFHRTARRKDFSLVPPEKTVLNLAEDAGLTVAGVGKIIDIFAGSGITSYQKTADNMEGVNVTIKYLEEDFGGIIFTNLVDFDTMYGHRRDVEGYGNCLMEFDQRVPEILKALREDDLLIITADHGNDPTFKGTDHTREHIPILVAGSLVKKGANIGTRKSFADIGATMADLLDLPTTFSGSSFGKMILN